MSALPRAKVVFLGAPGVGKTSIISYIGTHTFDGETAPTLGAAYTEITGAKVRLQIWDIAGAETYRSIAPTYYQNADVAVIVLATNDAPTLGEAKDWVTQMVERCGSTPKLFLVGNKVDIEPRTVDLEDAEHTAEEIGATYLETSARNGRGIEDLVHSVSEAAEQSLASAPPAGSAQAVAGNEEPPEVKGPCC
jgi:small GTP-binding protein